MLQKTRAIVLQYIKYGESSVIVYCYTEQFGRISLLIPGVRKKNARVKLNMLQPLQVNEMDIYYKEKPGLMRLKDIRSCHFSDQVLNDTRKSSIALFIAEILYKTLKEEVKNSEQFAFIQSSIVALNKMERNWAFFYLKFLLDYTLYLGFYPNTQEMGTARYFDLKNGVFTQLQPYHEFYITGEDLKYLKKLFELENREAYPAFSRQVYNTLLDRLLDYYMFHMDGFSQLKSLPVVKEIFH